MLALRDSLKKATEETKHMKDVNKEHLEQLNLKQRGGESPQTNRVTEATSQQKGLNDGGAGSIVENESILDAGSNNHEDNAYGEQQSKEEKSMR